MPKTHADPAEIRLFAQQLKQFNAELKSSVSRINGQFNKLGETWQDDQHKKYAQQFQQTVRQLQNFVRASEEQIPVLLKKAQILEDFHK